MALRKWGEVKSVRGNIGGYIGCVAGGIVGLLIAPGNLKLIGLLAGIVVGGAIGHTFDPQKTVIYKEEEQAK